MAGIGPEECNKAFKHMPHYLGVAVVGSDYYPVECGGTVPPTELTTQPTSIGARVRTEDGPKHATLWRDPADQYTPLTPAELQAYGQAAIGAVLLGRDSVAASQLNDARERARQIA